LYEKYGKHINKCTPDKFVKCGSQLKIDFPNKNSAVPAKELKEFYSSLDDEDRAIAIQVESDLKEVAYIRFVRGRQSDKDASTRNTIYERGNYSYEYNQFETLQANQNGNEAELVQTEWVHNMFTLEFTELVRMAA
jgi:hypothetical protein